MAFIRKDTPLANTTDPGKGNISKSTIVPTKIDPTKMKLVDTKSVSRDSINNGRVVGRITENTSTFKGNASSPARKPAAVTPVRKPVASAPVVKKPVAKTPVKPSSAEETKIVRTKTFTPSEVKPEVKKPDTVQVKKPETPVKGFPSVEERKATRAKGKEWMYNRWAKPGQSREQFQRETDSIAKRNAAKNKSHERNILGGSLGKGGGGGCHSC
jgi:hypothetical protein